MRVVEGGKKKIIYVVTKSGLGGAGKYVLDLALEAKKSYDIVVSAGGAGALFETLSQKNIRTVSISSLKRDVSFFKEFHSFFFLFSFFKKERPDVVHVNSPKAGGLGGLSARMAGIKKIIYTAHGWSFYEDIPLLQKFLRKFISWLIVLLSTKTIAVSARDARAFDGWPFVKAKVIHIPNGIQNIDVHPKKEALKILKSHGIPTNKPIVGTIAELHANKGLSDLIDSARGVPDATFVIIGEGEKRRSLEEYIEKHALNDRVFLTGHILQAERLLSLYDIFVLPSIKEGLPYVLLEAGMQALPVVATNVGGIPDIIEHEKTGLLVEPYDPAKLAEALKRLIADESLRKRLGTALKQKVERDFSFDSMLEKTICLYSTRQK